MADMNLSVVSGRLMFEPVLKTVGRNDSTIAEIVVASECYGPKKDPEYIPLTVWHEKAKEVGTWPMGTFVLVHLRLGSREYNGRNYPELKVQAIERMDVETFLDDSSQQAAPVAPAAPRPATPRPAAAAVTVTPQADGGVEVDGEPEDDIPF
jgi:single-stranded DNA-binding protein